MPFPTPNTVSAAIINAELGRSGTATLEWNYSNTRNVSIQISGTVDAANLSFGVSTPTEGGASYDSILNGERLDLEAVSTATSGPTSANVRINLYSNGAGQYRQTENGSVLFAKTFIWIRSGETVGNYYVQYSNDGPNDPTGDTVNANLQLSTDREFILAASASAPPLGFDNMIRTSTGNLIMMYSTDGGTTKTIYFTRPVYLYAEAESGTA